MVLKNENLPANVDDAFSGLTLSGNYKIVGTKTVTRELLQQIDDRPFAVIVQAKETRGEIEVEETVDPETGELLPSPKKFTPWTFNVIDLSDGKERVLVANAAMRSGLKQSYPDASYVGKAFGMISRKEQHPKDPKKSLRRYMIRELVLEQAPTKE